MLREIEIGEIFAPFVLSEGPKENPFSPGFIGKADFESFVLMSKESLLNGIEFQTQLWDKMDRRGDFVRLLRLRTSPIQLDELGLREDKPLARWIRGSIPFGFKLEDPKGFSAEALLELQRLRLHEMQPTGRVEFMPKGLRDGTFGFSFEGPKDPTKLSEVRIRLIRAD